MFISLLCQNETITNKKNKKMNAKQKKFLTLNTQWIKLNKELRRVQFGLSKKDSEVLERKMNEINTKMKAIGLTEEEYNECYGA